MSRAPDFDELVGGADLPAEERARLLRAHEALLAAGPPPELPPALEHPPDPEPRVAFLPQRRRYTLIGLAAALALVAFGGGWLAGGRGGSFDTAFTRPMHGTTLAPNALATIRIADRDEAGNWPMRFSVNGLKSLPAGGYYELYLSRGGKPIATCGTFTVHGGTTVVRLNAPYDLRKFDGWLVTEHDVAGSTGAGPVVMTT
jgi:hypothetical protein